MIASAVLRGASAAPKLCSQDRRGPSPVSMWSAVTVPPEACAKAMAISAPCRDTAVTATGTSMSKRLPRRSSRSISRAIAIAKGPPNCAAARDLIMKFGAFRSRFATDQQQTVAFLGFGLDDVFGRLLDSSRNLGPVVLHIRGCRHIAGFGTLLERRFGAFGLALPLVWGFRRGVVKVKNRGRGPASTGQQTHHARGELAAWTGIYSDEKPFDVRDKTPGLELLTCQARLFLGRARAAGEGPAQHRRHRHRRDNRHRHDRGEQVLIEDAHRQPDWGDDDFGRAARVHPAAQRQCFR